MSPGAFDEVFPTALPALQQAAERAADPDSGEDERLAAADELAETLAALWPVAEARGEHFAELIAVLDAAAAALPERAGAGDCEAGIMVAELLAALEAHLADPADPDIVAALVETACSDAFDPPLSAEAAGQWLALSTRAGEVGPLTAALDDEPEDRPADHLDESERDADLEPTIGAEAPIVSEAEADRTAETALAAEPDEAALSAFGGETPMGAPAGPTGRAPATGAGPATLSEDAEEVLAVLASAVEDSRDELLGRLGELGRARSAKGRASAAAAARGVLGRFAEASESVGFAAFAEVCADLGLRIAALAEDGAWPAAAKPLLAQLDAIPERLLAYLTDPFDEGPRIALVGLLAAPHWSDPLPAADAAALADALYRDPLAIAPDDSPRRPLAIDAEDVSLVPAEDIDADVLASFRREGPALARALGSCVESLAAGRGSDETLREAQRFAHTLKGSANICGVRGVAVLGHHLEDLLEALAEQGLTPSSAFRDVLVAAADGLATMLDVLNGRERNDPTGFRAIAQEVLDWANRMDREGIAALAADAGETRAAVAAERRPPIALVALGAAPLLEETSHEAEPSDEAEAQAEPSVEAPAAPAGPAEEPYLQVPARSVDALLRLVGELSIALSQSEEQLLQSRRILAEAQELARINSSRVSQLQDLANLKGLAGTFANRRGRAASQDIRPDLHRNPLHDIVSSADEELELEQYSDLYVVARQLEEGVSDARTLGGSLDERIRALEDLTREQRVLGQELRELTMGTRMVPAGSVAARLQRAVRQTCRTTGKEADLTLTGGDVRLDGDVLDRLIPALMHVLRNCVDHGIESPEERALAGKPRRGQIAVAFAQAGGRIQVDLSDDGRGLDLERVRAKAIAVGLLGNWDNPTPEDLIQLTLKPGFSTRDRASQVSGRGVGMDVVDTTVRALNGTLAIESEAGVGYRLRIRLPASLLTLYCLLVRVGDELHALPANDVQQAVLSDEGAVSEGRDGRCFAYGGRTLPLAHLNALLGLPGSEPRGRFPVLIAEADGLSQAIAVDGLADSRELVVKPLGPLVPRLPGLVAATILGDGSVAPILDLRGVLRAGTGTGAVRGLTEAEAAPGLALPTVLIVDDSLGMRRALSQLVSDGGWRPLTARDGMDAIRVLEREPADCLLVDMEMPQMNGLELTAHVRAQPETRDLPIAMITSRSTERYRRQALATGVDRYFVKPYRDEDVLDFLHQALEREPA